MLAPQSRKPLPVPVLQLPEGKKALLENLVLEVLGELGPGVGMALLTGLEDSSLRDPALLVVRRIDVVRAVAVRALRDDLRSQGAGLDVVGS